MKQADIRALGWVMVACGLFLGGIGAVLAWFMAPTLLSPGVWIDGSVFEGTAQQGWMILGIFAVLVLLGAGALAAGYAQVVHGRRNLNAIAWVMTLTCGLFVVAAAIEAGLLF